LGSPIGAPGIANRVTLFLGLLLAGLAALITQVGFLLRHRGAVEAPDVDVQHPLASAVALFRSKWWSIGYALAALAYACHVGALTLAAMSLVQAVLAGGLVVLGVVAERFFGFHLERRQWAGVILTAAGLAMLAVTGEARSGQDSADYSVAAMLAFEGALVALGVALILSCRSRRKSHHGVLLGASAGLLFTTTHVAVKALSGKFDTTVAEMVLGPYVYLALLGGVVAFFASARSLQIGPAVPVIAVTAVAGNASAIPAGIIVFGDPVGGGTFEVAVRMLAFLLVIAAAALIPAPTRAALGNVAAEQQGADHRDDGRYERDAEADHVHKRQHKAHDRDRAGRAARQRELVGAAFAAASRGRSA
jgi:drug/metabolite transporter (DMT)-like permease